MTAAKINAITTKLTAAIRYAADNAVDLAEAVAIDPQGIGAQLLHADLLGDLAVVQALSAQLAAASMAQACAA